MYAQIPPPNLHFNHLSTANGLSQNINAFIHKDRQGFVWISSTDGLNRFDGQTVRVYRPQAGNPRSLVGNNMQSPFFEDEQGNLWFGTDGAINCYHFDTDDFSSFQVELDTTVFTGSYYILHRDKKGRFWTRLDNELYIITPPASIGASPQIKRLGPFSGVRHFLVQDAEGEINYAWSIQFRPSKTVFYYRIEGDTAMSMVPAMAPPDMPFPLRIVEGEQSSAWFCTVSGLWHIDYSSRSVLGQYNEFNGGNIGMVHHLVHFNEQIAYVATDIGLLIFDKIQRRFTNRYTHEPDNPSSLVSENMVHELYIDRDSVLWVSIWTKGVDYTKIGNVKFGLLGYKELLLPGETAFSTDALLLDDNNDLWLGSNMSNLRVLRPQGITTEPVYDAQNAGHNVGHMVRLRSGNVLMIGDKILSLYNVQNRLLNSFNAPLESGNLHKATCLNNGKVLVSTDHALFILDFTKTNQPVWTKQHLNGKPTNPISFQNLFQDNKGRIYVTTQNDCIDVYTFQNNSLTWITRFPFFDAVSALLESDSSIWIASRAMLGRINTHDIQPGNDIRPDTILNQSVYGLLTDNNGNLWFSTNNGIMCLKPGEKIPKQYHLSDGLQNYEYNASAYQKTPDGRLWFGGVDGVNYFHPDSVHDIQTKAPVLLTGLKVNDEPYASKTNISLLDTLDLTYDLNTLSFDFVVADYSDPQNTQHWYQMTRLNGDSPDKDWIKGQSARGFARYANLAPGEYLFKIKGANADGVVNPDLRTVFIVIHPPFWQTWWFITLCLLAGAMATYAGIRYYIRENLRLKNLKIREQSLQIEKQAALTKERNRIAGEMHDDLGGGLTSIRMLSERLTAKTDNPDMKNAVDKIADHAQSLVLRMSEIIWAMNSNFDTVDNLIAYIRRYSAEYLDEHHLRSVIHVPQNVPDLSISGEKRRNVYLAVKESLHNIVKHARAERVNIDFEIDNNQLAITVRDNGKGIDPDLLNQFCNGLYNMKKRLEDIGGTMTLANDEGTLITFTMPLNTKDS
ncbi:MAG: ATP-binding protein [Saprospiraceae bacterium]|nr:ATP-binding protein [Saprospiraceae bacterium]